MMTAATEAPQPLGRRERKKRETRARILGAASERFARQGFDATTIEEIAEAADVSRATFFKYFPGKSALVEKLGDAMTENFLDNVERVRRLEASTVDRLRRLFAESSERLEEQSELARALVFETVGRRRDLAERRSQTARLHEGLAGLLAEGQSVGEVRSDLPLTLLAKLLSGAYLEILLAWVVDPDYALGEELELAAHALDSMLRPRETPS